MSEWKEICLKELAEIRVSNVDKKIHNGKSLVKLCNYMDVYSNDFISKKIPFQIGSADSKEMLRFGLKINDVIITKDSESPDDIAIPAVVKEDIDNLVCGYHLAILRPFTNKLDGTFLMYKLSHFELKNHFFSAANGSTRYGLVISDIANVSFKYPISIDEQQKIAHILTTIDAVIEKTEAAIAKYKAIKTGMMHDLFTRGIDDNGQLRPAYEDAPACYKQTALGWIPKEWEVVRLEEVTDYVDYRGKTPPKSEHGIFLVTARNIKNGFIDYGISKEYIPKYAFEATMSRGKAVIGDVVITTEAPMGNIAQIDREDIALAQRVIKYSGKADKLLNDYLAVNLMSDSFQRLLISESTGSTVLGIKGSRLHKICICLPTIEEQRAVSKIIKAHDALVRSEEIDLQKYQKLKQGLMQDLLTGKVVVSV